MDCRRYLCLASFFVVLIGTALLTSDASAQRAGAPRVAYNPVSGRAEPDTRYQAPTHQRDATPYFAPDDEQYYDPNTAVKQASFCECDSGFCGDEFCGDAGCECGDVACCEPVCGNAIGCGPCGRGPWKCYAGFEATFLKPHFGSNVAMTTTDTVGTATSVSETDFDYDLEFSPRVFVGWNRNCGDVGLRATWWQFDHGASPIAANPPTSGTDSIALPDFDGVDISSADMTDVVSAATDLNAYTIDLEATKTTNFCAWQFGMAGGLRYAFIEQGYRGGVSDDTGDALSEVDFRHSIEGIGPTIAFEALRPFGCQSAMFCKARGSILFGDSKSRLQAGEDLNGSTPTSTERTTASDDLLSICELQVGYRWQAAPSNCRAFRPFCSVAMEGQMWDGAGSASTQDGTLGFFGFNSAVGVNW